MLAKKITFENKIIVDKDVSMFRGQCVDSVPKQCDLSLTENSNIVNAPSFFFSFCKLNTFSPNFKNMNPSICCLLAWVSVLLICVYSCPDVGWGTPEVSGQRSALFWRGRGATRWWGKAAGSIDYKWVVLNFPYNTEVFTEMEVIFHLKLLSHQI